MVRATRGATQDPGGKVVGQVGLRVTGLTSNPVTKTSCIHTHSTDLSPNVMYSYTLHRPVSKRHVFIHTPQTCLQTSCIHTHRPVSKRHVFIHTPQTCLQTSCIHTHPTDLSPNVMYSYTPHRPVSKRHVFIHTPQTCLQTSCIHTHPTDLSPNVMYSYTPHRPISKPPHVLQQ